MAKKTYISHMHRLPSKEKSAAQSPTQPAPKSPGREHARRLFYSPPDNTEQAAIDEKPFYSLDGLQTLKALSIKQPYAGLIMAGIKNVENRSWFTNYRGPLAIVSTKKPDDTASFGRTRARCERLGVAFPEDLCKVNASVLGIVDFRYLVYKNERGREVTDHPTLTSDQVVMWWNSDHDMVGFVFEHPRILKTPIPITGRLGLYNLSPEVVAEIVAQFGERE